MLGRIVLPNRATVLRSTTEPSTTIATTFRAPSTRRFASSKSKSSPRSSPAADTLASQKALYRRIAMTGGVALCVIVGAYTGAQLKTDHQQARQAREVQELDIDEHIAMLEKTRGALVAQAAPLREKLAMVRMKMEEKEVEEKVWSGDEGESKK